MATFPSNAGIKSSNLAANYSSNASPCVITHVTLLCLHAHNEKNCTKIFFSHPKENENMNKLGIENKHTITLKFYFNACISLSSN